MSNVIITPRSLWQALDAPALRLFDCRFRLDDPGAGRRLWEQEHIPGAIHADLDAHLSSRVTPESGRHPLPVPAHFLAWCQRNGIDHDVRVVCYDDAGGAFAARLWWLLAVWLEHPRVEVLDGGFPFWCEQGYPTTAAHPPNPPPTQWSPEPRWDRVLTTSRMESLIEQGAPSPVFLDARSAERFRGDVEPIDPVAGHIPGAVNRPFTENLDPQGRWRPADELYKAFRALPCEDVVHMCGSGVTACHNALAYAYAGMDTGFTLYAGSWSEWVRDPRRPVAVGPDR